jgi:hypothetical protein
MHQKGFRGAAKQHFAHALLQNEPAGGDPDQQRSAG